ncbi:MAG: ArsA family ATPase [Bradymonadia bacterium]
MPPFTLNPTTLPPVIFVTGKGGVGKTTLCALLAERACAAGRRTLVCGMEVTEALGPLLQARDPLVHTPTAIRPGLDGLHLDIERAIVEAVARLLPTPRLARRLLDNRAFKRFLSTAPGARGFSALEAVAEHVDSGQWDQIIVDLPATGHALSLLDAPRALAEAIGRGSVVDRAHRLQRMLTDRRQSAMLLVTLPEEMPVNETLELFEKAETRLGVHPAMVVLNQLHAPPVRPALHGLLDRVLSAEDLTPAQQAHQRLVAQGLLRAQSESAQRDRLGHGLGTVPLITLPWRPASSEHARLRALLPHLDDLAATWTPALEALA